MTRTLVVSDAAGRIAWASAAASRLLGIAGLDAPGATLAALAAMPRLAEEAERVLAARDAARVPRQVEMPSGVVVTVRALATETRSAGLVIAAPSDAVEAVLDVEEPAVSCADRVGRVTWWDGQARRLFGWAHDEMLGRVAMLHTVPEESLDSVSVVSAATRQGHSRDWITVLKRKDGSRFTAEVSARPLLDRNGEVAGVMGLTRLAL